MDDHQPATPDVNPGASAVSTLHLGPGALKVLAHPLRSRLLAALRIGGPATATVLAGKLDTNTGATSYHLRRLAAVGLVEETEAGRGRERWWRASSAAHSWTERDVAGDPDGEAAGDWLRRSNLRMFVEGYEAWLTAKAGWSIEWREAADSSDFLVRVTPSELATLLDEVRALVERYRAPSPGDEGAEPVLVYVHPLPLAAVKEILP